LDQINCNNIKILYENEKPMDFEIKKMKSRTVTLIAAASKNNALGYKNELIWNIKEDLKRFKRLTIGHSIIMGRKTFESMPRALPGRKNIVLTRNIDFKAKDALIALDINEALKLTEKDDQPFVIGGGQIYSLFMEIGDRIELTRIHHEFKADTFFPKINLKIWRKVFEKHNSATQEQPLSYSFIRYEKIKKI